MMSYEQAFLSRYQHNDHRGLFVEDEQRSYLAREADTVKRRTTTTPDVTKNRCTSFTTRCSFDFRQSVRVHH